MHDVCLVGVSGSGKGYTANLFAPSGLDVRMFSAQRFDPWLPRGLPMARYYVRMWKADAWRTIRKREFGFPRYDRDDPEADELAKEVARQGWQAIDAELARLDTPYTTLNWKDRRDRPQETMDHLADWLGVNRWTVPEIEIY